MDNLTNMAMSLYQEYYLSYCVKCISQLSDFNKRIEYFKNGKNFEKWIYFFMRLSYLISTLLILIHILVASAAAETTNGKPNKSNDEDFLEFLSRALWHERELMSTITKENLLEMSGVSLVASKEKHPVIGVNKNVLLQMEAIKDLSFLNSQAVESFYEPVDLDLENFSGEAVDHLLLADVDIQVKCLAEAMYFEARGEHVLGQFAVGEVILNRVDSKDFPDSVCKVVSEGATKRHACQFSYNCDGKPEYVNDLKSYKRILKLSNMLFGGTARILTDGAIFYHSKAVSPSWITKMKKTSEIGRHIFYKLEKRLASN